MTDTILLIDDDKSLLRVTEYNLTEGGFHVLSAASGLEGLAIFNDRAVDLVVTDVQLGDMNGLELLATIKKESPSTPVIVITAFGSIKIAVKAMRCGAFNFLTKPFDREALRQSCRNGLQMKMLQDHKELLVEEVNRLTGTLGMETVNSAMADLLETAVKAASSKATIMISGESGTGKELLARLIHQHSPRSGGAMVSVNCAALPATLIESELFGHVKGAFTGAVASRKGRFQVADRGTLFLDEIGEMPVELQAKILRVVQENEVEPVGSDQVEKVDVRLITATNKNLLKAVEDGEFREDLYYRLCVIPLDLPPLRERREDIPALAEHFMKKLALPAEVTIEADAIELMMAYSWPGNIREMQNVIERSVILRSSDKIQASDLNLRELGGDGSVPIRLPKEGIDLVEVEKQLIVQALAMADNNQSEAARLLSIPRHVLLYRLEKYNLK